MSVCLPVCLSSLMSRVITSTLNQTVAYWLQGEMSCHCSLAKCCAGSRLNVAQERLSDFDSHQNFVSFLQLLFLSRFASFLILFIPKGNGRGNLSFLHAFAKLRQTIVSFVMSGTTQLPLDGYSRNLIF